MARTSLNVIKFTAYNQAIYPFDYYVECEAATVGKLTVVENSASTNQIDWNDDSLIGADGNALYSEYAANKYVLKVLGFLQKPDVTTKEFEFSMGEKDEKYILVAKNTAIVPEYYVECEAADTGAISVKASGATGDDQIDYDNTALVGPDGVVLYTSAPTGKYVKKVSGDKTLTIKKGNSIQGVLDSAYNLRHGGTYYIVLESGRYKNVTGLDKGKVVLAATDTLVEVAALCLE